MRTKQQNPFELEGLNMRNLVDLRRKPVVAYVDRSQTTADGLRVFTRIRVEVSFDHDGAIERISATVYGRIISDGVLRVAGHVDDGEVELTQEEIAHVRHVILCTNAKPYTFLH